MEKFFFFFLLLLTKPPPPFGTTIVTCTHVNDRGERGKKRKRGAGGRKRERGEKRGEISKGTQSTASDECRNQWPPCFPFTGPPYYETFPPPFPPPLPPPPRIPLLADFPTPRQTAIEPLYTLVCASEEYILHRQAAVHEQESVISIIITALVAFAE